MAGGLLKVLELLMMIVGAVLVAVYGFCVDFV